MSLTRLESRLLVVSEAVGVAAYDFDFDREFPLATDAKAFQV